MLTTKYIQKNEDLLRDKVVNETYKWLGANYHHMGMCKYKAADCMTLLLQVYGEVGLIEKSEPEYYPPDFLFHRGTELYLDGIAKHGYETNQHKKGNIILYKIGRVYSHSAIIVDHPTIIHAVVDKGVILDDDSQAFLTKYKKQIFSFWKD